MAVRSNLLEAWIRNPDDYTHERDIGAGSLGTVTLVKCKATGELFARREIREAAPAAAAPDPDPAAPAGARAGPKAPADKNFMREISFFMAVRPHPAMCTFHGWWFAQSRTILRQDLPEGSLHSIITATPDKRPAWYTPTVQAKVVFGFAASLMHLHAHGAVHRYLTPKNLMFDANHEPRLIDFGFANLSLDSASQSTIGSGENTSYVAPEVFSLNEQSQAMDVFSFAMIVNQMVTGQRPYADCRTTFLVSKAIQDGRRPAIPACHEMLRLIMELGWGAAPETRPSFAEIVSRLVLIDAPLFPGVDMAQYRDYRDRVMKATMKRPEDEEFFNAKADLAPEKVAEYQGIKAAAEKNDPEAMVRLGRFYEIGHGVVQNNEDAAEWYERAARAGNPTGMFNLAIMAHTGQGCDQDFDVAVEWYRRAAAAGIHTAEILLAGLMAEGKGFAAADAAGAAAIYRRLAEPPVANKDAQYHLGRMYDEGRGLPRDPAAARRYFELSHNQGGDAATCDLAAMFLQGRDGIPANVKLGIETLNQAASRGHPMSHYNLGLIYQEGKYGQAKDLDAAREHFQFAAEHHIPFAQVKFGTMLVVEGRRETDEAVKREKLETAARYFKLAAGTTIEGNPVAQNNYAKMLMTGEGVEQNYALAKEYLLLAIHGNQWMAFVNMAEILLKGLGGTTVNRQQAIELLTRAKDNGNQEAFRRLHELGLA
jgi:TPR repeat protein